MTININELRQLTQAATPGPWFSDRRGNIWRRPLSDLYENGGGVAGDKPLAFVAAGWAGEGVAGYPFEANARLIAAANPAAITELLDRLEAAEKERDDVAQQLVQSEQGKRRISEECDELRAELETERMRLAACGVVALANTPDSAKRARDMRSEYWSASCEDVARMVDQNIELRAKIAEMERQKPAGKFIQHPSNGLWEQDGYGDNPDARPLYALPGAKGE